MRMPSSAVVAVARPSQAPILRSNVSARELGLASFGANVPQEALGTALRGAVAAAPTVTRIDASIVGIAQTADQALVQLDHGDSIAARLVVAADGRASRCREAAGIASETSDYPQIAIAAQFSHSRAHRSISTEFHRAAGPCTVVPMPGHRSSLVWVERPALARRLGALDDADFRPALEARLHGVLGMIGAIGPRRLFPLSCLKAARLGANRVALVGEAGHALPPIGAQGLNLGFRDAATLVDLVTDAMAAGHDIGGADLLERYTTARRSDIALRTTAVDWLNRSLLADALPADLARGAGLHLIGGFGALRRQVMRAGFEPTGALPSLMRAPAGA
jgi:2-octaprenyl-6-methoxyphenol hydroxylase